MGSLFEAIRFISKSEREKLGENLVPSKCIKSVSYYEAATWFRELELRWVPRSYTLVSRGLFVSFFLALGRGALAERLAEKAWKFYLLPSREDSRLLRSTKSEILGKLLLEGSLGCFSWKRATERICVLLNECKARVLEEAIKRQVGTLQRFQLEVAKYTDLFDGLESQSKLLALAPFAVVRGNIAQLQLEFDKAHRVRDSDDISQWLHLEVRLFLDPFATLTKRQSKTVASNKATVLNYLTSMCRGIEEARALALNSNDLNWFVQEVLTRDVTPTRGDARRRRRNLTVLPSIKAAAEMGIESVSGLGTKS
jgi:predicted DNA-binding transcriptional regulator